MRDRLDEFGDAVVVVVTFSAPAAVAEYQRRLLAPLDVLIDAHREVYAAYGLGRGSVAQVWGPRAWRAYARLLRQGRRFRRPREDTLQLGGDFVIDRRGRVRYAYRGRDPSDRPPIEELIAIVSTLRE